MRKLVCRHRRIQSAGGGDVLAEEEILLEILDDQLVCSKCGGKMRPIGKKLLRHEMQIIPKRIKLSTFYAVTCAYDRCEKERGFAHIVSVRV